MNKLNHCSMYQTASTLHRELLSIWYSMFYDMNNHSHFHFVPWLAVLHSFSSQERDNEDEKRIPITDTTIGKWLVVTPPLLYHERKISCNLQSYQEWPEPRVRAEWGQVCDTGRVFRGGSPSPVNTVCPSSSGQHPALRPGWCLGLPSVTISSDMASSLAVLWHNNIIPVLWHSDN